METFSALLAICVVTDELSAQKPVTRSFDVFFDPRLNEWLSKQSWGWLFERPSHLLWNIRYDNIWADILSIVHVYFRSSYYYAVSLHLFITNKACCASSFRDIQRSLFNSSRPSDISTRPSLVHLLACRQFGVKNLSQSKLAYHQFNFLIAIMWNMNQHKNSFTKFTKNMSSADANLVWSTTHSLWEWWKYFSFFIKPLHNGKIFCLIQ